MADTTEEQEKRRWLPLYAAAPRDWATHPRKRMLMTPALVFFGGIFAYAVPTLVAGFFHVLFFHPPISHEWTPLATSNPVAGTAGSPVGDAVHGRQLFVANGCVYCHSGYTRPQDTRQGQFYLYPRVSLPGDFATSEDSPNLFGTARIGPDLSNEGGVHPDDWHWAHYSNPRYVDPDSLMPRFIFLSDNEVRDLVFFMQTRGLKSNLVRYAAQLYMKRLFMVAQNLPAPPTGMQAGERKSLREVSLEQSNAPDPVSGTIDGLDWPDPINLNVVDRGYWMMSNPMPVTTDNLLRGRTIFQERCIGCHGQGGSAVSRACGFMSPQPLPFSHPDDQIGGNDTSPGDFYYRVLRGINGTAMENFGTRLRVDDIWKVVLFLKTIPNGGLEPDKVPTPDMYIQWQPPDTLLQYIAKHPIDQNKDFLEFDAASNVASANAAGATSTPPPPGGTSATNTVTTTDPFVLEARRALAGLNDNDKFDLPGYGEISLDAAARDIKAIYGQLLDAQYSSYQQRAGYPPPPPGQKEMLPQLQEQLR